MLDEARLSYLISAYLDQQLGADELGELESMLLGSARAREILAERGEWHGLLREWALRGQTAGVMGEAGDAEEPAVISQPFRWKRWLPAAIAACLALAAILLTRRTPEPPPTAGLPPVPVASPAAAGPGGDEVALLAQAVDAEWEIGSPSFSVGAALPKGWLKLRRGTLRLDFYSGARVFLEGPAAIDLMSQDLARLERGRLTAHVPPPAQGFTILNANLRVVDRGTEFGMNVSSPNDCEVHVFDGEVELQGDVPALRERSLFEGKGVSIRQGVWETISADRRSFIDPTALHKAADDEIRERWRSWHDASLAFRETPGLLVYYDFENLDPGTDSMPNLALGASETTQGFIIGCEPGTGRWPGKSALSFAKTSDRIRFRTEGTTPSITLMTSVRVDSLPLAHNALFSMSPGQIGEIHWKLDKEGRLLLGIRASQKMEFASWERLESPCVVTPQDFGRWMRLATVIDGENGRMHHYVNGTEIASATMKRRPPIQLGMANLGNVDGMSSQPDTLTMVRHFNGRMDEFALITRALSAEEIRGIR